MQYVTVFETSLLRTPYVEFRLERLEDPILHMLLVRHIPKVSICFDRILFEKS